MSGWVRVETRFISHPKVLDVGPLGESLWLRGLCYAGEHLTDGFVPLTFLKRMGDMKAITVAGKLVSVGLWHEADGGYRIHDYLDWQRSREDADEISSKRAEAGKKGGKQKASNLLANSQELAKQNAGKPSSKTLAALKEIDTETEENKRTPPVVPQESDAPPKPAASTPKPRTDRQVKADAIYERKMRIVEACFRGLGVEPDTLPWNQRKGQSLAALSPVILASPECTPEIVEPLTRYARHAYSWRNGKQIPSLGEVLHAFAEWDEAGRPDEVPPKAGRLSVVAGNPRRDQAKANMDRVLAIAKGGES